MRSVFFLYLRLRVRSFGLVYGRLLLFRVFGFIVLGYLVYGGVGIVVSVFVGVFCVRRLVFLGWRIVCLFGFGGLVFACYRGWGGIIGFRMYCFGFWFIL